MPGDRLEAARALDALMQVMDDPRYTPEWYAWREADESYTPRPRPYGLLPYRPAEGDERVDLELDLGLHRDIFTGEVT